MFKPGEIEGIPVGIEKQFSQLEQRIMEDVIRRIKINGEITRAADWQIHRLHELGESKRVIKKYIKDTLGLNTQEINHIYKNVIRRGYERDESIYKYKGRPMIPFEENLGLQQLIYAVTAQTQGSLQNITQTMGFAKKQGGKLVFTELSDYYQKTLDGAMLDITSGAFDYNTVLRRITQELTNSGLRTVDYASGRSIRVESAARTAVMTGVSQVTAQINESNAKQLGTEYFEVTWHGGARPTHQVWQGRVYSKEELETVCGLGAADGLCGCNCYHDYYPFFPGISERSYTDEELDKLNKEENTPVEYNGKQYTKYEATQHQRYLERKMRAQRQEINVLEKGGASEDEIINARCRYRGTSSEYTRFSNAMDLPQQRERVTVDGLGNVGVGKYKIPKDNMSKERVYNGKTWSKTGTKITEQQYNDLMKHAEEKGIKLISFQNFDGDVDLIHEMIDNADKVIKDFPMLANGKTRLQIHNSFGMDDDDFAQTVGNKIYINNFAYRNRELLEKEYEKLMKDGWFVNETNYNSIIYHELGHAVTNVYGLSPMKIAKSVTDFKYDDIVLKFVKSNLSKYSAKLTNGREIISEVFSSVYSKTNNQFALNYFSECANIIRKRGV